MADGYARAPGVRDQHGLDQRCADLALRPRDPSAAGSGSSPSPATPTADPTGRQPGDRGLPAYKPATKFSAQVDDVGLVRRPAAQRLLGGHGQRHPGPVRLRAAGLSGDCRRGLLTADRRPVPPGQVSVPPVASDRARPDGGGRGRPRLGAARRPAIVAAVG